MVSLSSTESEYKALSFGAQESIWLRQLFRDINPTTLPRTSLSCKNFKVTSAAHNSDLAEKSTIVHCDNENAIKLAKNPVFHARSKHIGIQHHFIRERVALDKIIIYFLSTKLQPADMLTKALPRLKFNQHQHFLGLRNISTLSDDSLVSLPSSSNA